MTPAIPLLVGWFCMAWLFAVFPAPRWRDKAVATALFVVLAAAAGLVLDRSWQMLLVGLLMIGSAAAVGASLVQVLLGSDVQAPTNRTPFAQTTSSRTQTGVRLIAWSWLLGGLLNAAIGLLQYFQMTAWLGELVNHAPVGQVYGNLRQRNQFATLMNLSLWALWYLWSGGGLQQGLQWLAGKKRLAPAWGAGAAWGLMVPLAVCMALTLSRTGLMQLAAMAAMLLWWVWRGQRAQWRMLALWLAGLVGVYFLAGFVMPYLAGVTDIWTRLEGTDSRACISRTVLWGNVLQLVAQKPWTGWGWGELDWAHYYANYPGMRFCEMLDNAHNLPLHLAVELGVPVAVAFCTLVAGWVWRNRPWADTSPLRQLMWGVLVAVAIHSLLEYPLWYAPFQLACGLALGVLWATPRQGAAAPVPVVGMAWWRRPWASMSVMRWQRGMALAMLVLLAYAAFDFARVTQLYLAPEDRPALFRQDTLEQAARTPLYQNALHFAEISMVPVTADNAQAQLAVAQQLMHYSPEARVVERIITCLYLLGRNDEAQREEQHFAAVYPQEYAKWMENLRNGGQGDAADEESGAAE